MVWNETEPTPPDAESRARDRQHAEGARAAIRAANEAVRGRAGTGSGQPQERASASVHAVADVLRSSANVLRESDAPAAADCLEQAARRLDDAARRWSDEDLASLTASIEDYARRQPALLFGASLVCGLAIGRALRIPPVRRHTRSNAGGLEEAANRTQDGGGSAEHWPAEKAGSGRRRQDGSDRARHTWRSTLGEQPLVLGLSAVVFGALIGAALPATEHNQ
jgi:hypothetical protein